MVEGGNGEQPQDEFHETSDALASVAARVSDRARDWSLYRSFVCLFCLFVVIYLFVCFYIFVCLFVCCISAKSIRLSGILQGFTICFLPLDFQTFGQDGLSQNRLRNEFKFNGCVENLGTAVAMLWDHDCLLLTPKVCPKELVMYLPRTTRRHVVGRNANEPTGHPHSQARDFPTRWLGCNMYACTYCMKTHYADHHEGAEMFDGVKNPVFVKPHERTHVHRKRWLDWEQEHVHRLVRAYSKGIKTVCPTLKKSKEATCTCELECD